MNRKQRNKRAMEAKQDSVSIYGTDFKQRWHRDPVNVARVRAKRRAIFLQIEKDVKSDCSLDETKKALARWVAFKAIVDADYEIRKQAGKVANNGRA